MQSPDIRPSGGLLSNATGNNSQALLALLGQLKATSPSRPQPAQVIASQPGTEGGWRVTVELQGQRFTLNAPAPPMGNPLQLYRQNGQIRVAPNTQGQSMAGNPIRSLSGLLAAMPQSPSPAANVIQQALTSGGFSAWAAVFAQFTQPENIKRWVQANQEVRLLQQMAEQLPDEIKERLHQTQEHRQLQSIEDNRQNLHSLRFDVPLPLGERWVNGEACLKRASKERDHWSFELIFDLPTAGRLVVNADIRPAGVGLSLTAYNADTRERIQRWIPPMEQRLREAGLAVGAVQIKAPSNMSARRTESTLDIHI